MSRGSWLWFLIGAALVGAGPRTSSAAECVEETYNSGVLRIQSGLNSEGECLVSLTPLNTDQSFRSYYFVSSGLFLVTVSLDHGDRIDTGSRAMFLLPRKNALTTEVNYEGEVSVHTPSGLRFRFSPESGHLAGVEGASFTESPDVNLDNYGGVELTQLDRGLLLDTGWQAHGVAYFQRGRSSLFRDAQNHYCPVKNSELFTYDARSVHLSFADDAALSSFLAQRCPTLRTDALPSASR